MRAAVARGSLAALALAAGAALAVPGAASAHVTIAPTASRPADLQRYRLVVPNESPDGRPTTEVDVQLPPGITFALAAAQPPWRARLVRRGSAITEIRWTAGAIPADGYGELSFIARNPVRAGVATFKTVQRYAGGQVVRWIGGADSDHPSPTVQISDRATRQDVVSVHGQPTAPSSAATAPAAGAGAVTAAATRGDDHGAATNTIVLVAGLAGLVLGAAGLAVALRSARPGLS